MRGEGERRVEKVRLPHVMVREPCPLESTKSPKFIYYMDGIKRI